MRFYCAKCQAKYSIDDSKLPPGKVLRLSCKKCQSTIRISDGKVLEGATLREAAPAPAKSAPAPLEKVATKSKAGSSGERWYILIGQERQGPISKEALIDKCRNKIIDKHSFIWHKGMASWERLSEVPEFKELAEEVGTAPWRVAAPISDAEAAELTRQNQDSLSAGARQGQAVSADMLPSELSFSAYDTLMDAPMDANVGRVVNKDGSTSEEMPLISPMPMEPVTSEYYNAPPGEATKIFYATAGIYKRRKNHKIAAIAISCAFALLVTFIVCDANGWIQLPGMGAFYEKTDMLDPNKERGIERIQTKLTRKDITPEEREALRRKLHLYEEVDVNSLKQVKGKQNTAKKGKGSVKGAQATAQTPEYHEEFKEEAPAAKGTQQDLLAAMYSDSRKKDTKVELKLENKVSVSDLPAGLTQEAISQVIGESKGALRLCTAEAIKAGEKINGRMEVEFTITGNGKVSEVTIPTKKFKDSKMAGCVSRSVKRWIFPKFNGEPVTVSYPIIITLGI